MMAIHDRDAEIHDLDIKSHDILDVKIHDTVALFLNFALSKLNPHSG